MNSLTITRLQYRRTTVLGQWAVAIALYPLLRFVLLSGNIPALADLQQTERFLWLTFWPIEGLAIAYSVANGFSIHRSIAALSRRVKILLFVWLISLIVGCAVAPQSAEALRSVAGWLIHGVFALALWHLICCTPSRTEHQLNRFGDLLPWIAATIGILTVASVYRIGLSSGYPFGEDLPGFAHIRHSGYIFAPAMALSLSQIATRRGSAVTATILLALNVALCLWLGSRGPFAGLALGLSLAFLMSADFRCPWFIVRSGAAFGAGAILSLLLPSPENPAFNAIGRLWSGSSSLDEFSSGRTEFWKETALHLSDRPVFGHGGEQFRFISELANHKFRHPHDFLLQFLFDWGAAGGLAMLALIALAAAAALKLQRDGTPTSVAGMFGAASMLGFALLDGILFYPFPIAVTLVFLAMALLPSVEPSRASSAS